MSNIIKKHPMNSAAEKKVIEQWNKMSESQKQEFWQLKATEDQQKLKTFIQNDKKKTIQVPCTNGETLTLTKVSIPFQENEDFGHVIQESSSTGGSKQLMVVHKPSGVIQHFSQILLGNTIPDHVIGLTPEETEQRLIITHPYVHMEETILRANVDRDALVGAAKKQAIEMPILNNYWRESICQDYRVAEKGVIQTYKNAVTQCSAMSLLYDSAKKFFNVGLKYLYEIDVNTLTCMSTWKQLPVLKPILMDEELCMRYSKAPLNPPLVLAQLLCRMIAIKYDCEYTPNVVLTLPTSERFGKIGSQALSVDSQISALNAAQPLSHAEVLETGNVLQGSIYSFKLCRANLQSNKPSVFIMMELEEMKDVIDTARNQIGQNLFNQLFESFRSAFRDMFVLQVCNIPGLTSTLQLIQLDHVMNILSFINQNSKEAKPVVAITSTESTPQEQELDRLCQSFKSHEPLQILCKKILPDGTFDEETKIKGFGQRLPVKLSIDFLKIEEDESDSGELHEHE